MRYKKLKKMNYKYKECKLSYNISGAPMGFPVFINYGLIGDIDLSNLNQLAIQKNLKLIILERPGYGNSDYIEMNNYNNWGGIVESFLDFLEINEFSVIGISAGAPYAYSLANKLTMRVKGVYILSGVPFILDKSVFDEYQDKAVFYKKIWNYSQQEIEQEMYSLLNKYNNWFFKLILPKSIKRSFQSSLANNCAGVAQSVRLQMHDWGFAVYEIPIKIHFWHSSKDGEVSLDAVKVMIDKMKNAKLSISGKGHVPSKKIIKEVFCQIKNNI